jgi:hypothetical protein
LLLPPAIREEEEGERIDRKDKKEERWEEEKLVAVGER